VGKETVDTVSLTVLSPAAGGGVERGGPEILAGN
jgi:hypothetical protein